MIFYDKDVGKKKPCKQNKLLDHHAHNHSAMLEFQTNKPIIADAAT